MSHMIALIGLGNPGPNYEYSRHNVGFMVMDALAEVFKSVDTEALSWQTKKDFQAELTTTTTNGAKLFLVKPQTFMNSSGKAVAALKKFYDLEPKDIWIVHDDLDLPLGKAQIRVGGGMAGHHGLESISHTIGTEDYGRIRIGIRGQELRNFHQQQGIDTNDFVMGNFTNKEKDVLHRVIDEVVRAVSELVETTTVNSRTITVAGYETFSGAND